MSTENYFGYIDRRRADKNASVNKTLQFALNEWQHRYRKPAALPFAMPALPFAIC